MLRFQRGWCLVLVFGELTRCPFRPPWARNAGHSRARLSKGSEFNWANRAQLQNLFAVSPNRRFHDLTKVADVQGPGGASSGRLCRADVDDVSTTRLAVAVVGWQSLVCSETAIEKIEKMVFLSHLCKASRSAGSRLASSDPPSASPSTPIDVFALPHPSPRSVSDDSSCRVIALQQNHSLCFPAPHPCRRRLCRPLRERYESRQPQGKGKAMRDSFS